MAYQFMQCSAAASLILLTACGGGGGGAGGGGVTDTTPFVDNGATAAVPISAVSLNSVQRATGSETGTFDQSADTFALGGLSGKVDAAGQTVTLADGGQIAIAAGSTEHAARFIAEPIGGNRVIGIVGFETAPGDLPIGSASYVGTSDLTILDGTNVYALTGNATMTADFSGGSGVDTTLTNLSGTVTAGAAAPSSVTNVANIAFTGSALSGAQFTGGMSAVESQMLTALSGSETVSLNGAFYGPGADEAGSTFVIDDDANGGIIVFGTALAD
jgi:hypothetical protein